MGSKSQSDENCKHGHDKPSYLFDIPHKSNFGALSFGEAELFADVDHNCEIERNIQISFSVTLQSSMAQTRCSMASVSIPFQPARENAKTCSKS